MDYSKYHLFLKNNGISLIDQGFNETVLNKKKSLSAIEILRELKIPILGGDIYRLRLTDNEIVCTFDSWYCQRDEYNSYDEYLKYSWDISYKYITAYNDNEDGSIFYCIVIPLK